MTKRWVSATNLGLSIWLVEVSALLVNTLSLLWSPLYMRPSNYLRGDGDLDPRLQSGNPAANWASRIVVFLGVCYPY